MKTARMAMVLMGAAMLAACGEPDAQPRNPVADRVAPIRAEAEAASREMQAAEARMQAEAAAAAGDSAPRP